MFVSGLTALKTLLLAKISSSAQKKHIQLQEVLAEEDLLPDFSLHMLCIHLL